MGCDFRKEYLDAYTLAILADEEKEKVIRHINICSECSTIVKNRREIVHMLDFAFKDANIPGWIVQDIMHTIEQPLQRKKRKLFRVSVIAITILLIICISLLMQKYKIGREHFIENAPLTAIKMRKTRYTSTMRAKEEEYEKESVKNEHADDAKQRMSLKSLERISKSTKNVFKDNFISIELNFKNPAADRSIYKRLGIQKAIASLLL